MASIQYPNPDVFVLSAFLTSFGTLARGLYVKPHRLRPTCRLCGAAAAEGLLERVLRLTPTPPANAFVARRCPSNPRGGESVADKPDATTDMVAEAEEVDGEGFPIQHTFPLDLYHCCRCSHLQLLDIVSPEVLFRHYVYVSGTSPVMVAHLKAYAEWAARGLALGEGELVLEFGSNDGTLLTFFKGHGMRVLGVDPAANIAARATAAGIETLPEFFTPAVAQRLRSARGAAALVVANHVCAHIDDLAAAVEAVRIMLRPGGAFIFEVGYLLDVYSKDFFDTVYHEHVDFHHVGPLMPFFAARGMRLVQAHRADIQGGALRCVVRKVERVAADDDLSGDRDALGDSVESSNLPPLLEDNGSVETLRTLERNAGLDDAATFSRWSASIARKGLELSTLLGGLRAAGKRVAAFGAPAKATTLMYHFGLDAGLVEYVVDDNPLKQGLYTPGLHVPVVSADSLYRPETRPDYVVVLAWNFAGSIIDRNARFGAEGGRWIVPLPDLYIK